VVYLPKNFLLRLGVAIVITRKVYCCSRCEFLSICTLGAKKKTSRSIPKIIATEHEYVFQGLIKVIENGISRLPELEFHEH
jgi:hypothetical protein